MLLSINDCKKVKTYPEVTDNLIEKISLTNPLFIVNDIYVGEFVKRTIYSMFTNGNHVVVNMKPYHTWRTITNRAEKQFVNISTYIYVFDNENIDIFKKIMFLMKNRKSLNFKMYLK